MSSIRTCRRVAEQEADLFAGGVFQNVVDLLLRGWAEPLGVRKHHVGTDGLSTAVATLLSSLLTNIASQVLVHRIRSKLLNSLYHVGTDNLSPVSWQSLPVKSVLLHRITSTCELH